MNSLPGMPFLHLFNALRANGWMHEVAFTSNARRVHPIQEGRIDSGSWLEGDLRLVN